MTTADLGEWRRRQHGSWTWRDSNDLPFLQRHYPGWRIRIRDSGKWAAVRPGTLLSADSASELLAKLDAVAAAEQGVRLG